MKGLKANHKYCKGITIEDTRDANERMMQDNRSEESRSTVQPDTEFL